MAKKVTGFVKLQIPAGKANPAPPVGTALGPQGINIMAFCKEFNARTQGSDSILPVEITIYADKSFSFILKTPPAAFLVGQAVAITDGPFTDFNGTVEDVMADKGKVRVSVSLFGRPTSVELDYLQLKGH